MFDGADLSVVYGGSGLMSQQASPPAPPPPQPMPELTVPKSTASHAMPPEPPYTPPPAMYAQQAPSGAMIPQDSFWDRLGQKRSEIVKLIMLALVVLLAIALDRFVTHYLGSYTAKSFLSETNEFLVRLAYPLSVIVIMWVIKAM